ncbi:MAG: methyltransferase domain-containing protein [Phycisphaerae bacterium]
MGDATAQSLTAVLLDLYRRCKEAGRYDPYMALHGSPAAVACRVRTFLWYRRFLPAGGRVLDWGCHHAPDSCLVRAALGDGNELHGCDFDVPGLFPAFHEFAALRYVRLLDHAALPYDDGYLDAVIGAGALEHSADDRACIAELRRCLKPGGILVVTYLPNRWSYEEWFSRLRHRPSHDRLYALKGLDGMLKDAGFIPLEMGYQARSGALSAVSGASPVRTAAMRLAQLHRLTGCLCVAARKREDAAARQDGR